jgi:SPP1 gp7 family putative phage head morphogenesis protein
VLFSPVREAIARAAGDAAGAASAEDAIRAAVAAYKGDPQLEALIYEASVKSDLAGQMFVRLVELDAMGSQRQLQADLRPSFLKMPFAEAVAFWRERGGDPAILEEVLRAYRRRASMATDEQLDVISRRAVDELQRSLDTGSTLRDFQRDIEQQAITLGIAPADPSYLENVYRTNVASAYGAGRWQQMNDPDVIEARPYRQWFTARDSRVRAEHAVMESVVWRADDPSFSSIAPPAGFQCRCAIVTVSQDEFDDEGLAARLVSSPPAGFVITPGFGASSFVR